MLASLGCGNPTAVADLREGETVLDLGSGGGIDVLLSARRVGASGFAYGLDMTDEMLELARANAAKAGTTNVEFLKGQIEKIPLADASVDVVTCSQVLHHFDGEPMLALLRELPAGSRLRLRDLAADPYRLLRATPGSAPLGVEALLARLRAEAPQVLPA